ncbi:MAG TPA: hypothetical protein VI876_04550 [Dehalococcoidia bacterium]|nr:hypothetical protein [Dehalococcoidia bacterium]
MAKLVGVFGMVHTPFCYIPPGQWEQIRQSRNLRPDVPHDGDEAEGKAQRIRHAFDDLREKIDESRPDVFLIFGDDQREYLDFDNYPSFAIYAGDEFTGALSAHDTARYLHPNEGIEVPHRTVKGHPELAAALLTGLRDRDFDPAFCLETESTPQVGHAFMRPLESVTDFSIPAVPVMINCYFAPQMTAGRCYKLGTAVREIVESMPSDLRVAVIGSGGLWHTPGAKDAYLDEQFDRESLRYLETGDIFGAARFFDGYQTPAGDTSQPVGERNRTATGLPSSTGPQGGTREFCNWIAAAAVADAKPWTIIDYVPVYSSPVGAGFGYCIP